MHSFVDGKHEHSQLLTARRPLYAYVRLEKSGNSASLSRRPPPAPPAAPAPAAAPAAAASVEEEHSVPIVPPSGPSFASPLPEGLSPVTVATLDRAFRSSAELTAPAAHPVTRLALSETVGAGIVGRFRSIAPAGAALSTRFMQLHVDEAVRGGMRIGLTSATAEQLRTESYAPSEGGASGPPLSQAGLSDFLLCAIDTAFIDLDGCERLGALLLGPHPSATLQIYTLARGEDPSRGWSMLIELPVPRETLAQPLHWFVELQSRFHSVELQLAPVPSRIVERGNRRDFERVVPPAPPAPPRAELQHESPGSGETLQPSGSSTAEPKDEEKQLLGERLFPLIASVEPGLAGKITGMLLEMDNTDLEQLIESPGELHAKISEAICVLQVCRDRGFLMISAGLTYDGGHFLLQVHAEDSAAAEEEAPPLREGATCADGVRLLLRCCEDRRAAAP